MRMHKGLTCVSCGAQWKRKHKEGCQRAKFGKNVWGLAQNVGPVPAAPPTAPPQPTVIQDLVNALNNHPGPKEKKLVNHIAFVIDASGSMGVIRRKVCEVFNEQINLIKKKAYETKQDTRVKVVLFNIKPWDLPGVHGAVHPAAIPPLSHANYVPNGGTALFDALLTTVKEMTLPPGALLDESVDHAFLVYVLTDGEENSSRLYNAAEVIEDIKRLQGTDRWTFAFMVPSRYALRNFGIPEGNILEWQQDEIGTTVRTQLGVSTQSYYDSRSAGYSNLGSGRASHLSAFVPDLSKVKDEDLKGMMDYSGQFRSMTIPSEQDIAPFVEKQTGRPYQPGMAFYELMKTEKVQAHKDIMVKDRRSGKLFGGLAARHLIGLPSPYPGQEVRVKPGNHGNFKIFVQSTSMNRKLVRGTELLVKK